MQKIRMRQITGKLFLVKAVKYRCTFASDFMLQACCKAYVHRDTVSGPSAPYKCHANANISVPLVM